MIIETEQRGPGAHEAVSGFPLTLPAWCDGCQLICLSEHVSTRILSSTVSAPRMILTTAEGRNPLWGAATSGGPPAVISDSQGLRPVVATVANQRVAATLSGSRRGRFPSSSFSHLGPARVSQTPVERTMIMNRSIRWLTLPACVAMAVTGCAGSSATGAADPTASDPTAFPSPVQAALPTGGSPVTLDPSDFSAEITNPYWPMRPRTRWTYREIEEDGAVKTVVVVATTKTKRIANGITARVVRDTVRPGRAPRAPGRRCPSPDAGSGARWLRRRPPRRR